MRALFNNDNLVIRWDVLHMANRSHISARGNTALDNDTLQLASAPQTLLSKTMSYVQSESKKWRSGAAYTQLVIDNVDSMRPKIYSTTRMCL